MKSSLALTLIALLAGGAVSEQANDGPIDKVVTLLKTLSSDLNNDEKSEQATYDKYACWCEETTARKAANIEAAKTAMKRLGQDILKHKGTIAVRTDEVAEKQDEIKENEEAQEMAALARSKENGAWQAESAETAQAMTAINAAMGVLIKASKPALLQQDSSASLMASLSAVLNAAPMKALAALSPAKLAQLQSFVQVKGKAGYAPQSMTIQGILGDMYTTMGVDVQEDTALEARRNRAFEDFMAEKDKALAELNKILTKKQREMTEAEAMLAEATEAYDDTSSQFKADVEFFDITKKACQEKTDEWKVRHDLRTDEIEGIDEAIKILTSDEAKKLFKSAIKPGQEFMFLQVASTPSHNQAGLDKLYGKLKEKASRSHNMGLAAVAAQVRMAKAGHFDEVLQAIDKLIGVLAKEQEADTTKRNDCEEEYQDIAKESKKLEWMIKNNKAKIDKLDNLIEKRGEEKDATIQEIKDTNDKLKEMKATRTTENEAFIQAKKEDLATIKILDQAKDAMLEFYKKNAVAMKLLQESADPLSDPDKAPDATFSDKGKRKGQSKGIVAILTMVIEDLHREVENGVAGEAEAQTSYEKAKAAAEELLADLKATKVSLEEAIAKRKKEKGDEQKDQKSNEGDLDAQKKQKKDIQEDCDYMIAKYEERRGYRTDETQALNDAKEFLSSYYD